MRLGQALQHDHRDLAGGLLLIGGEARHPGDHLRKQAPPLRVRDDAGVGLVALRADLDGDREVRKQVVVPVGVGGRAR